MTIGSAINLRRTYTLEKYEALPKPDRYYELVKGKLIRLDINGDRHGRICINLSMELVLFVKLHKLGRVLLNTGFVLDATDPAKPTVRIPDLAFIAASRVIPVTEKSVQGPPDLAVEVVSPSDVLANIINKVRMYQKAGVSLVWVIEPSSQVVWVYRLEKELVPQVLGVQDELSGEAVIPDFKLSVKALFED